MLEVDQTEFRLWARYVYDISGISLEPAKSYLIESRLGPLLNEYACRKFSDLYQKSKMDSTRTIEKRIIDQITTNETFFFRDNAPFEMLKYKILPDIVDRKTQNAFSNSPISLRIWSAGCSTGQEVYSIAIALQEILGDLNPYNVTVLGTDISSLAIARASQGMYSRFEMDRGLTSERMERYFVPEGGMWKVKDEIRSLATFKKMNLMQPFLGLGKFDIIFCRNVAIYFMMDDRKKLFRHIEDILAADGCLIIGSTESLTGIAPRFEPKRHLRSVFYQLKK
ncbi:MAG: protein-glutamate O-methyltransferase CheR [Deltaproteobacteria bacterium]|nr:protein-glutamate O-methyltransferase CheR [Deltaproteobacteria bacterium]